jgi:hypothetical protein
MHPIQGATGLVDYEETLQKEDVDDAVDSCSPIG